MMFPSILRRALLPAVAAATLAAAGPVGAATDAAGVAQAAPAGKVKPPEDRTVDTPPNASRTYYYLDPANPLATDTEKVRPATGLPEGKPDGLQGKPDKNNHLPVKPRPGPKAKAGYYRLTPIPF